MVVFFLSSISGLIRWVDYIPVKTVVAADAVENTTDGGGCLKVDTLSATAGLQAWVHYVPVYEDASATDAWQCSGVGYLPIEEGGGVALPQIDYLMVVGSSTMEMTFGQSQYTSSTAPGFTQIGSQVHYARAAMCARGIDVPIISKAAGGSGIAYLDANINTYLADVAGLSNVGVLIDIGANDIGLTAYGSMAQATKDAMVAGLNSICDKIIAAGHTPIVATTRSRPGSQATFDGWATNFYHPIAAVKSPEFTRNGSSVFDFNALYALHQGDADVLNNPSTYNTVSTGSDGVPDWWSGDQTHPLLAIPGNQAYVAEQLDTYAQCPSLSSVEKFIVAFRIGAIANVYGGINVYNTAGNGSISAINSPNFGHSGAFNSQGARKSVDIVVTNADSISSTIRSGVGNQDIGITNRLLQTGYLYKSSATTGPQIQFQGGAPYAGRTGTCRVTFNTSNVGRTTAYSVNGGASQNLTGDTAGVQTVDLPFTADGSGNVTLTCTNVAGNFPSVSGVSFEFD
jgi:hypothetical protein